MDNAVNICFLITTAAEWGKQVLFLKYILTKGATASS